MNSSHNTILITGGGSGIGLALAQKLSTLNNRILITGRDPAKLAQAAAPLPNTTAIACDLTDAASVSQLVARVQTDFKDLTMLINNAGHSFSHELGTGPDVFARAESEMMTNYLAPLRLTELLLPLLRAQPVAAIVNVTSIVALAPSFRLPTYSVSKAALHSYSQILRFTLARTSNVRVFELMPPVVNTTAAADIGGENGIPPEQVAEALVAALEKDEFEIHVGQTAQFYEFYRVNPAQALAALNSR